MSFYTDFEDSVYRALSTMFPTASFVFANDNGPEEQTPCGIIQVIALDQVGRESVSTLTDNTRKVLVTKTYEGRVSLTFVGSSETNLQAAELAADFDFFVESPVQQDILLREKLSLMRKSRINRVPMRWDTVWYTGYQLDVFFAFTVAAEQSVDTIEKTIYTGVFTKYNDSEPVVITQTIN